VDCHSAVAVSKIFKIAADALDVAVEHDADKLPLYLPTWRGINKDDDGGRRRYPFNVTTTEFTLDQLSESGTRAQSPAWMDRLERESVELYRSYSEER
jgi:hypothetical protein